jgi:hypothetical protein
VRIAENHVDLTGGNACGFDAFDSSRGSNLPGSLGDGLRCISEASGAGKESYYAVIAEYSITAVSAANYVAPGNFGDRDRHHFFNDKWIAGETGVNQVTSDEHEVGVEPGVTIDMIVTVTAMNFIVPGATCEKVRGERAID